MVDRNNRFGTGETLEFVTLNIALYETDKIFTHGNFIERRRAYTEVSSGRPGTLLAVDDSRSSEIGTTELVVRQFHRETFALIRHRRIHQSDVGHVKRLNIASEIAES